MRLGLFKSQLTTWQHNSDPLTLGEAPYQRSKKMPYALNKVARKMLAGGAQSNHAQSDILIEYQVW